MNHILQVFSDLINYLFDKGQLKAKIIVGSWTYIILSGKSSSINSEGITQEAH